MADRVSKMRNGDGTCTMTSRYEHMRDEQTQGTGRS